MPFDMLFRLLLVMGVMFSMILGTSVGVIAKDLQKPEKHCWKAIGLEYVGLCENPIYRRNSTAYCWLPDDNAGCLSHDPDDPDGEK